MGIKIKTPFERAEPAGKKILAQAVAEHKRREEYGKKETYQAAKEAATFLVHQSRGRVTIFGTSSYCCFDCLLHNKNEKVKEQSICHKLCTNGEYFQRKGAN